MLNKRISCISFIFIISLFISLIFCTPIFAKDLDSINKYYITVNPRTDGSLNIKYNIEWEVLDSTSEGPLSWVQIGIPNSKVDNIKATSSNIRSISYSSNGGDFVKIYFDKPYTKGEIVRFSFSIHQSYMYSIKNGICNYKFTPGWFDDIAVKDIQILWKTDDVLNSTSKEKNSDGYYVWKDSLKKGDKLQAEVNYKTSAFKDLNVNKQISNVNKKQETSQVQIDFIIIIIFLTKFKVNTKKQSLIGSVSPV